VEQIVHSLKSSVQMLEALRVPANIVELGNLELYKHFLVFELLSTSEVSKNGQMLEGMRMKPENTNLVNGDSLLMSS